MPRAITGVLTMPEVVNNGVVTFRVNGRIASTVPSTLYAKVRIPVTAADVIADGTIGLTMTSQGPAIGDVCRPAAGEASLRKIALSYRGQERPRRAWRTSSRRPAAGSTSSSRRTPTTTCSRPGSPRSPPSAAATRREHRIELGARADAADAASRASASSSSPPGVRAR